MPHLTPIDVAEVLGLSEEDISKEASLGLQHIERHKKADISANDKSAFI